VAPDLRVQYGYNIIPTDMDRETNMVNLSESHPSDRKIVKAMLIFAEYTRYALKKGKIDIVKNCLETISKLYAVSDENIKDIIIGNYLYSLNVTLTYSHCENLIPQALQEAYSKLNKLLQFERMANKDEL